MEKELLQTLQTNYGLTKKEVVTEEMLKEQLTIAIQQLIEKDFTKLIFILYRVDVNEKKLKKILENTNESAADVIASLIIEREIEKYHSRKKNTNTNDTGTEEKW